VALQKFPIRFDRKEQLTVSLASISMDNISNTRVNTSKQMKRDTSRSIKLNTGKRRKLCHRRLELHGSQFK